MAANKIKEMTYYRIMWELLRKVNTFSQGRETAVGHFRISWTHGPKPTQVRGEGIKTEIEHIRDQFLLL